MPEATAGLRARWPQVYGSLAKPVRKPVPSAGRAAPASRCHGRWRRDGKMIVVGYQDLNLGLFPVRGFPSAFSFYLGNDLL